jgi:hypothetical protein
MAHWHSLPALLGLCFYVASHHLAVAPHFSAKYQFYSPVYGITLNSSFEAQIVSKILIISDRQGQKPKFIDG